MKKIVLATIVALVVTGCSLGKPKRKAGATILTAHYSCPANSNFTMYFLPDFTGGELEEKESGERYTLIREGEKKTSIYRDPVTGVSVKENLKKYEAEIDLGTGQMLHCRLRLS